MERIKEYAVPLIVMFGASAMGLTGMYLNIPHSGWLLAIGILTGLFTDWD